MVGVEQILMINTAVFAVVLIVLLYVSGRKNHKPVKKGKKTLSSDMAKIKEQISEDI